jgi:hypothetical protein
MLNALLRVLRCALSSLHELLVPVFAQPILSPLWSTIQTVPLEAGNIALMNYSAEYHHITTLLDKAAV